MPLKGGETIYTVTQYRPKLSVIAWHGKTKYDLTPYIMQVTTHKALGEPMGQFALLLKYQQRWERLLSPMDYVEIRMARYASTPQMIMRGFISNVRRTRTQSNDGKWRRTVTINGNDYGKLLQQYQIYYAANTPGQSGPGTDNDPVMGLLVDQLFENMGIGGSGSSPLMLLNQFIPALVSGINGKPGLISSWIKSLQKATPAIPNIVVNTDVLSQYQLLWMSLQSIQGSLVDVINQYANVPWCEWFVYDVEAYPKLVHRNTPFKDSGGKYIFPESALDPRYWPTVTITNADIIEDDVGFSDAEVCDYFFTYPSLFTAGDLMYKYDVISSTNEFGSGGTQGLAQEANASYPSNPKVNETDVYKYGLLIMEQASPAIPVIDDSSDLGAALSIRMNMWLANAYGWGAQQLNGTINIKGNENVTIGRYLFSKDVGEEYYIESVDHTFTVSQPNSPGNDSTFSFTTSVGVTRGRITTTPDSGSEPASATTYA